jgi:ATP-dependent DNA helicase RecQ
VYFRSQDLAKRCEVDNATVSHALRELNRLNAFTYVPAFRGRAIRMIRRDLSFDELDVDFESMEALKAAEYEKLNRMIRFALGSRCRQEDILRYFGQHQSTPCGHCDNCRRRGLGAPGLSAVSAADPQVLQVIRIVLSGVARVEKQLRHLCGKNLIAQMLCGSSSAKMNRLGLSRLSTYGLLRHLKQAEVATLIDGLIASGHVEQVDVDRNRPVVRLTESGKELMQGRAGSDVELPVPPDLLSKLSPKASLSAEKDPVESPREAIPHTPQAEGVQPSHYWTWRLLSAGFTPEECMAIRGVSRQVVIDHALQACEEGRIVRAEWCLSGDLIAAIEGLVGQDSPKQPATLLSGLPPGTRYEELTLFLKCRRHSR